MPSTPVSAQPKPCPPGKRLRKGSAEPGASPCLCWRFFLSLLARPWRCRLYHPSETARRCRLAPACHRGEGEIDAPKSAKLGSRVWPGRIHDRLPHAARAGNGARQRRADRLQLPAARPDRRHGPRCSDPQGLDLVPGAVERQGPVPRRRRDSRYASKTEILLQFADGKFMLLVAAGMEEPMGPWPKDCSIRRSA